MLAPAEPNKRLQVQCVIMETGKVAAQRKHPWLASLCLASMRVSRAVGAQVLSGDGSEHLYRSRIFLGADGVPVTFQVGRAMALLCAHMMAPSFMALFATGWLSSVWHVLHRRQLPGL